MFRIYDGRDMFYQWDLNRKLIVDDSTIKEVHFCNRTDSCSLVCQTYKDGDFNVVDVPNILLQTNWKIHIYAYNDYTKHEEVFDVIQRTKPADYIYTEVEILNYDALVERIEAIENSGGGGGTIDLSDYAKKEDLPTKITDLEDNTNDLNPINYARYADSSYLAENVKNAENANIAQYAERDYINNVIHETYATKAEVPTKISQLTDDTNDLNPINYARYAESCYTAENVIGEVQNAIFAEYSTRDYINNVIHETYATKAELAAAIGEALEGDY
jgi:hypothetical protein